MRKLVKGRLFMVRPVRDRVPVRRVGAAHEGAYLLGGGNGAVAAGATPELGIPARLRRLDDLVAPACSQRDSDSDSDSE